MVCVSFYSLTSSNFNRFCARSFLAGSPFTFHFSQPAAFSSIFLPFLAKYAMRVAHQNREAKMANRVSRRYQCVEKLPSVTVVTRRYFVRNFPDRDFLPITRGAFYQRLSMVNSIKIRRTEMTASCVHDRLDGLLVRRRHGPANSSYESSPCSESEKT